MQANKVPDAQWEVVATDLFTFENGLLFGLLLRRKTTFPITSS